MNKKKILIPAGAAVAALLVLYIGFALFFMSHFCFATTVKGVAVGGSSIDEAKARIEQMAADYVLTLTERDGTQETISAKDIQLKVDWKNELETYMEQQSGFAWIVKIFSPDAYDENLNITYDAAKLDEKLASLSCMQEKKQVSPQNAFVEYDGKNFVVREEKQGTKVNVVKLKQEFISHIKSLNSELDLVADGCYYDPEITADDERFATVIDQLDQALETVITYEIGASKEVLDADVFTEWLSVNEDFEIEVDEEGLSAFVKDMGQKYNTCYSAKKLMTTYGVEVTIPNSHYGWKIDDEAEMDAIKTEILAGEPVTRDLHYSMTAHSHEGPDYGNSYVEMNLTAQHLFLYVNGELVVESDFVSGNLAKNYNTPTGAFSLSYKERNAVLRGDNYATPVSYWMPYAGNVGMHDATWRSEFGGDIYKTNGSHGCVNLPKNNARIIFEYIEKGFPVLCYELPGTEPVPVVEDPFAQPYMGF